MGPSGPDAGPECNFDHCANLQRSRFTPAFVSKQRGRQGLRHKHPSELGEHEAGHVRWPDAGKRLRQRSRQRHRGLANDVLAVNQ